MALPSVDNLLRIDSLLTELLIHTVFLVLLTANIFYLYQSWQLQKSLQNLQEQYLRLVQINQAAEVQEDYYNSEAYFRKYAKEQGYALKGEIVIDPMLRENTPINENTEFIPTTIQQRISNREKWTKCFFGGVFLPQNQQAKQAYLNSWCRIN